MTWLVEPNDEGLIPVVEVTESAGEAFAATTPSAGILLGGVAAGVAGLMTLLKVKGKSK